MPVPSTRNTPVLCLDTCAILDIVRDPTRDTIRLHEHEASLALLQAAETDKRLVVLVAEQVRKEFEENADDVQKEAKRAIVKFRNRINEINDLAGLYGSSARVDSSHWEDHELRCLEVAERWLEVGDSVSHSNQILSRATSRSIQARSPARKGKDSIKDCVILETYFERVRELREDGLTAPMVFVSSNTRDYAELSGARIQNDIKDEFGSLALGYAPNMAAAKHMLNL